MALAMGSWRLEMVGDMAGLREQRMGESANPDSPIRWLLAQQHGQVEAARVVYTQVELVGLLVVGPGGGIDQRDRLAIDQEGEGLAGLEAGDGRLACIGSVDWQEAVLTGLIDGEAAGHLANRSAHVDRRAGRGGQAGELDLAGADGGGRGGRGEGAKSWLLAGRAGEGVKSSARGWPWPALMSAARRSAQPGTDQLSPAGRTSGTGACWFKAATTAFCTARNTARSSRKRTSALAGCTLTST